jgi:hypothetical protein
MSDTPTPRTNKAFLDGHTFCKEDMMPAVAFASQLERELTTVTEQRDRLAEALKETISGYDVVTESIPSLCSDYVHNVIDPLLAAVKGGSE